MEETPCGKGQGVCIERDGAGEREDREREPPRICASRSSWSRLAQILEKKKPVLEGAEAEIDGVRKIEGERSQTTDRTG